jgi:hypothetical protein
MDRSVPAILPLSVLEAIQNIDTPADDGLGALEHELASKRLGLSATVAAQVRRYRERAEAEESVSGDEALAVFRLVGRRPDAELVYADAGRRAARWAARRQSRATRALGAVLPGRFGTAIRLGAAGALARRWLLADLRRAAVLARCEMLESLPLEAREDGAGCHFYTAALGELLRLVGHVEGVMAHEACRGRGDARCIWLANRAEGYD